MARYDDLSTGPIAYAAFVSTIIFVVIFLLIRALCYSWVETEEARKFAEAHYVSSDQAIAQQKSKIQKYDKQTVEIPPPEGSAPNTPSSVEERILIPVSRAKEVLMQDWSSGS